MKVVSRLQSLRKPRVIDGWMIEDTAVCDTRLLGHLNGRSNGPVSIHRLVMPSLSFVQSASVVAF